LHDLVTTCWPTNTIRPFRRDPRIVGKTFFISTSPRSLIVGGLARGKEFTGHRSALRFRRLFISGNGWARLSSPGSRMKSNKRDFEQKSLQPSAGFEAPGRISFAPGERPAPSRKTLTREPCRMIIPGRTWGGRGQIRLGKPGFFVLFRFFIYFWTSRKLLSSPSLEF